jgi:hypothetical protein
LAHGTLLGHEPAWVIGNGSILNRPLMGSHDRGAVSLARSTGFS